ncbi:MAG TPA: type II secretion system protein [Chthonomonadales bacterium]|nr:type II secretion system protein [Chthonomonadales bacterium]
MKRTASRRAFTLVEILTVIVILAALTAILFPVFARARENARRAMCKSNLRQIWYALSAYRQDYDGIDPQKGLPLSHSDMGLPYHWAIFHFFEQYLKDRGVLFCPSFQPGPGQGWPASSYEWACIASEQTDPSLDWETIAARLGPDYPLVICPSHNGPEIPRSERSSSEILYYHVLRIDGRIEVKKIPAIVHLHFEDW